jgi:hypothetical protein
MVNFNDIQEEDLDTYDSKTFKNFKKYKQYKKKLEENDTNIPAGSYIEQKYFNCLKCGAVNLVQDIINEKMDNKTMRARYLTWKKFKDISNELGGSLENGLLYLISLHERADKTYNDEREIGIAGFGGEDKKKK